MSNPIHEAVFIKRRGVYHKIKIRDIIYLEANGDYVACQLVGDDKFVFRSTLKAALSLLPPSQFLRVHRSYAVQIDQITGINFQEGSLFLSDHSVPTNRESRKVLSKLITRLE